MKKAIVAVAVGMLAGCMGGSDGPTLATMAAPIPDTSVSASGAGTSNTFEQMLNGVRAANGSAPLQYDARLGRAAQLHANDMLAMGTMTHVGSDGSNGGQRIARQGYNWRTWGENVARGYQTEASVLDGWVNSPDHQANNINPSFEDFGLAKAGSGSQLYWALVFATEQ